MRTEKLTECFVPLDKLRGGGGCAVKSILASVYVINYSPFQCGSSAVELFCLFLVLELW